MAWHGDNALAPAHAAGASKRKGSAFTLVELLVVVAIIALLATMLIPVLERGLELARRAACMVNCRELPRACTLYAEEARLRQPSPLRLFPTVGSTSANWHDGTSANREVLQLMVTYKFLSPESLMCPSLDDSQADRISSTNNPCGYSFLSTVGRTLNMAELHPSIVLVADRNPRFAPNSKDILADTLHVNSNTHRASGGQPEGQHVGRRDESASWLTTPMVNTGARLNDYFYESVNPNSDSSGTAGALDDVLTLN